MNVAFIPVRGGSKSIPLKNIKAMHGKPLVYWSIKAAGECEYIDKVYVATDSDIIHQTVEGFRLENNADFMKKVEVVGRTAESATDSASTECALLEFAAEHAFDNIALIQATSPLLTGYDLDRGFHAFFSDGADSVVSVVRQKRFLWQNDDQGYAQPTNYDVGGRPRRQDFEGLLVENGAFYITTRNGLLQSGNRISGNIKTVEMDENTYFEIDEPSDWMIVETLMAKKEAFALRDRWSAVQMVLTDCDGCLTDGGMYYSEHGDEMKKFNTRDGMGFAILREKGIVTGIITGEKVELNRRRAKKLGIDIFEDGCMDKAEAVKRCCQKYGIEVGNVVYIGDDLNDLEAVKMVGFGCCPADATDEVKQAAKYVSRTKGGGGVLREIADMI